MIALDLFAGTGWGVACQRLGIEEYGVEIMPEARAVRAANGMKTWYADVWQGLEADVRRFDAAAFFDLYSLLIASPPCQTFSLAGGGAGRRALDEVLKLIDDRAYLDPAALRAFGETHDPRTALVLTPLAYIARDVPLHVVLEQVPPALPVWERYAEEMRAWGYSVWTGILSAEQYGVPQTRKRAILIARADGIEAAPPLPTHSKYYPRDPERLDEGVMPWVSMAEALGWNARPGDLVARSSFGKPKTHHKDGARAGGHHTFDPAASPSHTVTGIVSGWSVTERIMRSNYGTGGDPEARGERDAGAPSPTMTSKADRNQWVGKRPATTVAGDARVWPPGHKVNADDERRLGAEARERYGDRAGTKAERVTIAEAAALQSYPPSFVWDAEVVDPRTKKLKPITKTKTFLQIGNAVPPLLAEAVIAAAIERPSHA